MPRGTLIAPATLPLSATSAGSRTSTTSVSGLPSLSRASAALIRGTAALAASSSCLRVVAMSSSFCRVRSWAKLSCRMLFEFPSIGCQMIPGVSTRREDVHARPVRGRVVEASRHQPDNIRQLLQSVRDPAAAGGAKAALHAMPTLAHGLVIAQLALDSKRVLGDHDHRGEGAAARTLAVAAVAVQHDDRIRRRLIAHGPA